MNTAERVHPKPGDVGEWHPNAKHTKEQVLEIYAMFHEQGLSIRAIAARTKTKRCTVASIVYGWTWRSVTGGLPKAARSGKHIRGAGEQHPNAKLNERKVLRAYRLYHEKGWRVKDIAVELDLRQATVSSIVNGYSWQSVTGHARPIKEEIPEKEERFLWEGKNCELCGQQAVVVICDHSINMSRTETHLRCVAHNRNPRILLDNIPEESL